MTTDRENVVRLPRRSFDAWQSEPEPLRPFFASQMEGRPLPDLEWIVDGVLLRGTVCILAGAPKIGKCCGRGTPILMFDGSIRPVEDVKEGDILMGPDSKPRLVRGVTSGYGPLYRVTPNKGDPYVVNEHHVLSLRFTPKRKQRLFPFPVNIPIKGYLGLSENKRHHLKGWRAGVDWPTRTVPIDPYLLGLWLGDGSEGMPEITSADGEVVSAALEEFAVGHSLAIERRGKRNVYDIRKLTVNERSDKGHGKARPYRLTGAKGAPNPFSEALRGLGIFRNKHIPKIYLCNDVTTRLKLLAGLIDTDGNLCKSGCYEITQKRTALAKEIIFLARSLGFGATERITMKASQVSEPRPYHRVIISGDIERIPVRIARKVHVRNTPKNRNSLLCGIKVEPIGDGEYFGFEVDGDHLFLLGDFTVTHNSMLLQQLLTSVSIGADWLGRETVQSKAFGLFAEDPQHILERRETAILAHYDRTPADLEADLSWESRDSKDALLAEFDRFGSKPKFTSLWHDLWTFVEEDGINLVGLDTAATVFGGNEVSREHVTAFLRALQKQAVRMNGCIVLNVHPAKANMNGYSGTTAWLASARAGLSLGRPTDYDQETGEPANVRVLRGLGSNYGAGITAERIEYQDGVFVQAEPDAPRGKRGPLNYTERMDLRYRLLIGLKRVLMNGGKCPADELDPKSMPYRARRSTDPSINRVAMNELNLAQHEMLESGQLVRVNVSGRCLVRPHDGPYYPDGESPWQMPAAPGAKQ